VSESPITTNRPSETFFSSSSSAQAGASASKSAPVHIAQWLNRRDRRT
jgi:hypothetical protein